MPWEAIIILAGQGILLAVFSFFAFFNYLYGFANFWRPRIPRTRPSGKRIAVVIVAFNEEHVLEDTIRACDALTYPNKRIILADDSTDPTIVENLRRYAISRGCKKIARHGFYQEERTGAGQSRNIPIEIWESSDFVLFHRPNNRGFKAGSIQKVHEYLDQSGIELMYLLDADWCPQRDALERTLEVLEADEHVAFVQTKRISSPKGMNLLQKHVALSEEGCYYVDNPGRQVIGHPILFTGCCALIRLDAVTMVGGVSPGHLTEDLDLVNRFWLKGWRGVYLSDVINYGEVPFTYDHFYRQQQRWAAGTARALREFFWPILKSKELKWFEKLSAIRQNTYFVTGLFTEAAILLGMVTITWIGLRWNSYSVEYYLYVLGSVKLPFVLLIYTCLLSNFVEPFCMILVKKRKVSDLAYLPLMVWYNWSVIPAYALGSIQGFCNISLDWFRTPKFHRRRVGHLPRMPASARAINVCSFVALLGFYFAEGWLFGWFDEFALLLIPAFLLASVIR